MTKKSTSTKVSLFIVFVLASTIFSVNGNVYSQETLSDALNVTQVPVANSTNTSNATNVTSSVPVEEELLPTTTTPSTTTANATNVTSSVPVEEELLPTTTSTDGLNTQEATSAAPTDEVTQQTDAHENVSSTASNNIVTRDSQTILLEGESLPEGSFIHLYDSTPYQIMNGHIAAKLPCNEANSTDVNVLIGQAPNLQAAELEYVSALSTPGELCLYHVDIATDEANPITDIAIQNNSTDDTDFPATSTVVIGVNEIAPLAGGHQE